MPADPGMRAPVRGCAERGAGAECPRGQPFEDTSIAELAPAGTRAESPGGTSRYASRLDVVSGGTCRSASRRMSAAFLRAVALLLCLLSTQGCSVQLSSPFSEQIARHASDFQESFIAFAANMRSKVGTQAGTAAANDATYNGLMAKLVSMQSLSELLAAGVDCRVLAARVRGEAQRTFPGLAELLSQGAAVEQENGGAASCQTRLIELIQRQLMELRRIHEEDCAPGRPVRGCLSIWGPSHAFGILAIDPDSSDSTRRVGRPVYFVLSATRALIFVIENKAARRDRRL